LETSSREYELWDYNWVEWFTLPGYDYFYSTIVEFNSFVIETMYGNEGGLVPILCATAFYSTKSGTAPSFPPNQYTQNYPFDPSTLPVTPVKVYKNALLDHASIVRDFPNVTGIYLWHNCVTGEQYIGSGYRLSARLATYFFPSRLSANRPINKSICQFGHNNFTVVVLEVISTTGGVNKKDWLAKEQWWLEELKSSLNVLTRATSSLGFRHSSETKQYLRDLRLGKHLSQDTRNKLSSVFSGIKNPFYGKKHSEESKVLMSENKQGENNPMYGKEKSPEFLSQQLRDKSGDNNPMWGKTHSEETRKKLSTPIYVFDCTTKNLIAEFSGIVVAKKEMRIGYDTLKKYLKSGMPYKGQIFSYSQNPFGK